MVVMCNRKRYTLNILLASSMTIRVVRSLDKLKRTRQVSLNVFSALLKSSIRTRNSTFVTSKNIKANRRFSCLVFNFTTRHTAKCILIMTRRASRSSPLPATPRHQATALHVVVIVLRVRCPQSLPARNVTVSKDFANNIPAPHPQYHVP